MPLPIEYIQGNVRPKLKPAPAPMPAPGLDSYAPPAPPAATSNPTPQQLLELAQGSPQYSQFLSGLNAASASDLAGGKSALQQALIQFGIVPEGFTDKFGSLDDLTRSLIQKNTKSGVSAYARLLEGRDDAIRSLISRLTSKGLRRSGARGYGLNRAQLGFDRDYSDAVARLLGQANSVYGDYSQREYQRQRDAADQLASALDWAGTNYRSTATGGSSPSGYSGGTASFSGSSAPSVPLFNVGGYQIPGGVLRAMGMGGF